MKVTSKPKLSLAPAIITAWIKITAFVFVRWIKRIIALFINWLLHFRIECALSHIWIMQSISRGGRMTQMFRRCKRCRQRQTLLVKTRKNGSQRLYWWYSD